MQSGKLSASKGSVVVTGVSSGIGAAIVRQLAAADYTVFGSVRAADDAASLKDSLGDRFEPLIFDVRDDEQVADAAEQVAKSLSASPLCGLVNNVGLAAFGPLECLDDETFETTITVNLFGTRTVTNAFLPLLRGKVGLHAGKIINVSSLSGILNSPMNGAYCIAKHALESLGEVYRRELLPDGIDVVALRSGPVQSEIWNRNRSDNAATAYKHPPYQRMAHKVQRNMKRAERDAIPAADIAAAVQEILERNTNRTAYYFSKGALTSRILASLPARMADRLIVGALMKPAKR